MEPERNQRSQQYPPNGRTLDPSTPGVYAGLPSMHSSMMPYSYMYSGLPPMYYPNYPYSSYTFPNNTYMPSHAQQWRDRGFAGVGPNTISGNSHSLHTQQNPRVTPRESRGKFDSEIICLDSEEEIQRPAHAPVPPLNNLKKSPEKQIQVIEIDDNSPAKVEKPKPFEPPRITDSAIKQTRKPVEPVRATSSLPRKIEKQKEQQPKPKPPPIQEVKTKPIRKAKKKQVYEISKSSKTSKDKPKVTEIAKTKPKEPKSIHRQSEKSYQKKQEKAQKQIVSTPKKKQEFVSTKQIAKYLESHGEIRHGKQFQSSIPSIRPVNTEEHRKWVQRKRKQLLSRQIGAFTY